MVIPDSSTTAVTTPLPSMDSPLPICHHQVFLQMQSEVYNHHQQYQIQPIYLMQHCILKTYYLPLQLKYQHHPNQILKQHHHHLVLIVVFEYDLKIIYNVLENLEDLQSFYLTVLKDHCSQHQVVHYNFH